MSVLIKGMEMPKSCHDCEMSALVDVSDGLAYGCQALKEMIFNARERLPNCPLVLVPEHGRLIDADALADVFRGFIAMYDSCPFSQLASTDKARRDELQAALAEVINAPTIIPAEEGEK